MKTMFRAMTITAALTCASVTRTFAQDETPEPATPPPPPVAIFHDVQGVAEGAVHKAQADVENHVRQVNTQLKKLRDVFMTRRGKTDKSLVVRSSAMEPRAQGDLEEDMAIMTHILDKAVAERSSENQYGHVAMGINVAFAPGERPTRSIYVDGYGALFFLNVDLPLLPPPAEKNVEKESAPKDSAWDEAREEVYGHSVKAWSSGPHADYDPTRVTALTNALLDAFKNASHLRNVRLDESITVCVIGAPLWSPVRVVTSSGGGGFGGGGQSFGGPSGGGGTGGPNGGGGSGGGSGAISSSSDYDSAQRDFDTIMRNYDWGNDDAPGNRTTLTIRAKKADCVAFANGKMTADEFRQRAVVTIYGEPAAKPE